MFAAVCLVTSLAGCSLGGGEQQATGEIVIGADLELTGATATTSKAYQRALDLKVQEINDSGVLGGRKLRLDIKDNRSDSSESLRNISALTANPAISAIIMGSCNECAVGAAKTVNERKVPAIALATANGVANPVGDRRYMFKLGPNAQDTAAALIAEFQQKNVRSVALLRTDDEYGSEGAGALSPDKLASSHITLKATEKVKSTDTDISQAVRALTKTKPDALVIWTAAEQSVLAANSAQAERFAGQLYFDAGAAGELFLNDVTPHAADKATLVFTQTMAIDDVVATTPAKAARKQWFRDYTARYGSYYGFASFAADALQLITNAALQAIGTNREVNRDGIRDVLETSQIDGLSGQIRMTPDNHSGLMPQALTILVARGNRWRLAG
jgi:branched-chain amino acid transport system substrate-binding protein